MTILVVDDEPFVKPLFEQRFRKEIQAGMFDFVFARSGEEALALLAGRGTAIHLVLTDHKMPGMSGLELVARIKAEHPLLPVYLLTAYNDEAHRSEAAAHGADGYFTKPIDFGALTRQMTALLP